MVDTQGNARTIAVYGPGRRAQKRVDDTVYMVLKITPDRGPMVEEIQAAVRASARERGDPLLR